MESKLIDMVLIGESRARQGTLVLSFTLSPANLRHLYIVIET